MHEHVTLLIRLGQIAGEPCSCEERASHALALLNAYTARLYARVGIGASNRVAMSTKSFADQTLADLRRQILLAEVHASDSCRKVFTALRHRIEMARRVLASRIVEDDISAASAPKMDQQQLDRLRISTMPRVHQDAQLIDTARRRLQDRELFARSTAAIEESLGLLEAHTPGPPLRLRRERFYRPCRRARLGSLSGQLTI
jgi:hypothetical protein